MAERAREGVPPAGGKRILQGVERIHWETTSSITLSGAIVACMRYLGEKVTNDQMMGLTGGAFFFFWQPEWSPANCALTLYGEEPVRRTFAALGYDYSYVADYDRERPAHPREFYRDRFVASIDRGVPAIGIGIVGPPECIVIAGYESGGDVLYGWSYFQEDPKAYFRAEDWFKECYGAIFIGEKRAAPARRQVLRDLLEWAITLTRGPEFESPVVSEGEQSPKRRHLSGLAAYDEVARVLLRDEEFPAGDPQALWLRLVALSADGVWLLSDKREVASRFTKGLAEEGHPEADALRTASEAYAKEAEVLVRARALAPGPWSPPEEQAKILDPARRRELSRLVLESKAHEQRALAGLEDAHRALAG